ncbi:potassium channel family protein [Sporobolomyces koalae]|uniref:potassium channel family protein n=1 Tax=Sporobolomyces koalae TaxID=500713 RepID=UPI00317155E4
MTHLGVDLARNAQPRLYTTRESRHTYRRLHRFASFCAQILCPLATLFALPALTEGWCVRRNAEHLIVAVKPDPPLIVAAGSVTLALSILSNISILFRLIDTHCRVFTLSTIGLLAAHIVLSVVSCLIFALHSQFAVDGYTLSTAFYLTVASAAIGLVVALALFIDGLQTQWYSRNGTGLSGAQCSLIIAFDIFVTWVVIGTVSFRYLLDHVNYLDALYFVIQCLITTGFGDIVPTSVGARIVMILFFIFGILQFAILICFTRATALEALQDRFKARERSILKSLSRRKKGMPKVNRDEKLVVLSYEDAIVKLQKERNRDFRSQLLVSLLLSLMVWLLSAVAYSKLEGWTYFEAFYFCFISFSTVGLGDLTPKTQAGRAFFCVFALLGAGVLTVFFSILADGYSSTFKETFQRNVLAKVVKHMHTKKSEPCENETETNPTVSTLAQIVQYRRNEETNEKPDQRAGSDEEVRDPRDELLQLLAETRSGLNHLIATGGDGDCKEVTRQVRQVMEKHTFKRRNREKVECDAAMKQFLYLRNLQCKFARLEHLAKELSGSGDGSTTASSSVMAHDSSSESTLAPCDEEAIKVEK